MGRRWVSGAIIGVIIILGLGVLVGPELLIWLSGETAVTGSDATVTVYDRVTNESRGQVGVDIAETPIERYTGLSHADSLPEDAGMLFVFDEPANRTFVMREMDFGLDIIFVDTSGQITAIHEAPAPGPDDDGTDQRYSGHGELVLEVNRGWAAARGIAVGDRVVVDRHETSPTG